MKILPDAFPRTNIRVIKDQNAFVVIGITQLINKLKSFIADIDKPSHQIMIDVLVVDFTSSSRKDFGIDEAEAKTGHISGSLFPTGGGVVPLPLTYYKKELIDEFFPCN